MAAAVRRAASSPPRFQNSLGHLLDEKGNAIRALDDVLTDMRWQQLVTDDAVNHRADVAFR
jgi:hypothetical protein